MSTLALGHPSIPQAVLDQLNVDPGVLGTPGCEGCTALSGLLQILLDALGETQRALGETQRASPLLGEGCHLYGSTTGDF